MTPEVLTVREMQASDISLIIDYWLDSDDLFLMSMGVDLDKLPSREAFEAMLHNQLHLPLEEKRSYCIIWEADEQPVGHSNTNPTSFGKEAYMHLHIWKEEFRRKGLGTAWLKMTLPFFFENLELQKLYSEPFAMNEAPNKTFEKCGFNMEKEYITIPGALNFEQPVRRWMLTLQDYRERQNK